MLSIFSCAYCFALLSPLILTLFINWLETRASQLLLLRWLEGTRRIRDYLSTLITVCWRAWVRIILSRNADLIKMIGPAFKKKTNRKPSSLFTYRTIHPFKVYNSVVFRMFRVAQQSILEHFPHPKKKSCPISSHCPFPPNSSPRLPSPPLASPRLPSPKATTDLLSVSVKYHFLAGSYKWNHTTCSLSCLSSFFQHSAFKVHHVVACNTSFLFKAEWYSILWLYHKLFIHSSVDGLLGCFHLSSIVNTAAMNFMGGFCAVICFQFFWVYMPRSGIAGS